MTCEPDDTQWLLDRIEKTKALIIAYEDGILALASGAQSYRLSTGQTDQMVTKGNLSSMRLTLQELEARLDSLNARLYGAGIHVRAGF